MQKEFARLPNPPSRFRPWWAGLVALLAFSGPAPVVQGQSSPEPVRLPSLPLLTLFQEETARGKGLRRIHIQDRRSWEQKRQEILSRVLHLMGPFPASPASLQITLEQEEERHGHWRRKIRYSSGTGDEITAWLLVPTGQAGRRPAVIALHPTASGGKDVVVGIDHRPGRNYGEELVQRGYVVLAPDVLSAGERILPGAQEYVTEPFDRSHPAWSMMGKMAWDHMRGVELLSTLPEVDPGRIGTIGHSLGGYNAIWLAAFDTRIRAAVSSCGWAALGGAPDPFAFSRREWFVHIPSLRHYFSAGLTPFDMHEVVALIAPRPFFNYSVREDEFFPNAGDIARHAEEVRAVYSFYGRDSDYRFLMEEGRHDFPDPFREQAYAFLDSYLKGSAR